MKFEYDARKSDLNLEKHGIDFEEAKRFWNDDDLLELPAKKRGERRSMVIAKMDGSCWSAVITRRDDAIRIVSVRRSTDMEMKVYEQHR